MIAPARTRGLVVSVYMVVLLTILTVGKLTLSLTASFTCGVV